MKVEIVITDDANIQERVEVDLRRYPLVRLLTDTLTFYCEKCHSTLLNLFMSSDETLCNNCFVDNQSYRLERLEGDR